MAGYMVAELWCDNCHERVQTEGQATLREHRALLHEQGWCAHRVASIPEVWSANKFGLDKTQKLVDFCCRGCCPICEFEEAR